MIICIGIISPILILCITPYTMDFSVIHKSHYCNFYGRIVTNSKRVISSFVDFYGLIDASVMGCQVVKAAIWYYQTENDKRIGECLITDSIILSIYIYVNAIYLNYKNILRIIIMK